MNEKEKELDERSKKIYNLRENWLSYALIARQLRINGEVISEETVRKECKRIYRFLGKEEPKLRREPGLERELTRNRRIISDEEIYNLREKGLSHGLIACHFTREGRKVSESTIGKRCKEIYERLGKEEPKLKGEKIKKVKNEGKSELETLEEKLQEAIATKKRSGELVKGYQELEGQLEKKKVGELGEQK